MVANDKLKMFYMILLNSEESIPVSYFTEKLAISAKTAYNYLKELDFELKRFDLKLVKQKQQGYLLEGSAEEKRRFRTGVIGKPFDEGSEGICENAGRKISGIQKQYRK